jgi:hypothetical protein
MLAKSPVATFYTRGFVEFVASPDAPIATGWSDSCRAGLAPAGDVRLFTAHGIMWARRRLAASAAESNLILQGIKNDSVEIVRVIELCLRVSLRHHDNSLFLKALPDRFFF